MSQMQEEFDKFQTVVKRILKTELSKNPDTLAQYRRHIILTYNNFIHFASENYAKLDRSKKSILENNVEEARNKLIKCLDNLKLEYELPNDLLEQVEPSKVSQISVEGQYTTGTGEVSIQNNQTESTQQDSKNEETEKLNLEEEARARQIRINIDEEERRFTEKQKETEKFEEERQRREANKEKERERIRREKEKNERENQEREKLRKDKERELKMAEALKAQRDLLDIVNKQIRETYNGDPLGLATFLSGIEIAKDFAYTEALQVKLVTYVKGRLEGRAREIITDDIDNIEDLIEKLKDNIKPENSKIIEGRISSLRYSYVKQEEFASKTEELADALRRTLIIEGMTAAKANEITIERTIQLCKKSTNSDVVKAVLSAASFNTSKEVVAKLITSNDEYVKDRQIMRYNKEGNRGNVRGKFNRGRGNNYKNFGRGGRGSYNGYNNGYNNGYKKNYSFNGNRGGYKPRGGNFGRGGYYQNNRFQNQQNGNNGWQVNRQQNVRLTQAGNGSVPQALMGGPIIRQAD